MFKLYWVHDRTEDGSRWLTACPNHRYEVVEEEVTSPEQLACSAASLVMYLQSEDEAANYHHTEGAYKVLLAILKAAGVSKQQVDQIFWHLAAAGGFNEMDKYQLPEVSHAPE